MIAGILILAACSVRNEKTTPVEINLVDANNAPTSVYADNPVLAQGEANYNLYCAHCHGYKGEGQIGSRAEPTIHLGMSLVPPHDSTGHTWLHPDQLLLLTIKEGIQNPLDHFPMPAFKNVLNDEQITAILEYIKLWWTDDQRAKQAQLTANWEEAQRGLVTEEAPFATATP